MCVEVCNGNVTVYDVTATFLIDSPLAPVTTSSRRSITVSKWSESQIRIGGEHASCYSGKQGVCVPIDNQYAIPAGPCADATEPRSRRKGGEDRPMEGCLRCSRACVFDFSEIDGLMRSPLLRSRLESGRAVHQEVAASRERPIAMVDN